MDQIRKRSTGPSDGGGSPSTSSDVETPPLRSLPNRRKREKATIPLMGIQNSKISTSTVISSLAGVSLLCLVSGILYATSLLNSPNQTFNRILHQDIPQNLDGHQGRISHHYLPQRPRMIGYYFSELSTDSYIGTERLEVNTYRLHRKRRKISVGKNAIKAQELLLDSREYEHSLADPLERGDCVAQYEWQKHSFPTCNIILEQDMTNFRWGENKTENLRLIGHGYWRDVWKVRDTRDLTVLKTMRWDHDFEDRNYDRHRRDAVAMEQLSSSRWIMDIYGFCGNSGVFEYADGGDLDDSLFSDDGEEWSGAEKLVVAYQVASGIADMHNSHKEGVPAIVHADITPAQFVHVSSVGIYKLNDFNRCRFLAWNQRKNQTCTFHIGNNPGTFRSPEEYNYEGESEKVDVYSMGNILYSLLTGIYPFEKISKSEKVQNLVKKGIRPPISKSILNTSDPFEQTLLNATLACWVQDPQKRATARSIQKYIETQLEKLGVPKS